MTCQEVIHKLSEYLDDELDASLADELRSHLQGCQDCCVVVDTTRKTIEMYCDCEPAPLPEDVQQRLQRALEQRLRSKE